MAALLDSSLLIAAERGDLDLPSFLREFGHTGLAVPAISVAELLHGVHRMRAGGKKVRAEAFLEALLARIPVVPFDTVCARAHARLGADLARRGVTAGGHDLQIAATALARGFEVFTRDKRSFPKIPDLVVRVF